jgi:ABC-type antimicrobial peptide transport system permease subunit
VSTLACIATLVGIPVGILVYRLFFEIIAIGMLDADPELYAGPRWWQLLLLIPAAIVVAALASGLPARLAARVRVAEALRYE